ncbi:unnamed protein product [Urochloa decumbens]|uniref:Uncharacterized protein n=1 Tax=Urochloa decumbens TaxID=240449 RepID=A0ABC8YGJ0_9POAL
MSKLEEMMKQMDKTAEETNRKLEGMQQSFDKLSLEQGSIQTWKPELEGKVTKLQQSVSDLQLKMDLFVHELPKPTAEGEELKVEAPAPAHLGATAKAEASGQNCHRVDNHHRGIGAGVVTTLVPSPVKAYFHALQF